MQKALELAITEVMEEGNGAKRFIPSVGGQWIKVSYLWGKLRLDFVLSDGKITLPARGVGGRAIATPSEDPVGEGAATPPPPVQLALPEVYLQVGRETHDDPD